MTGLLVGVMVSSALVASPAVSNSASTAVGDSASLRVQQASALQSPPRGRGPRGVGVPPGRRGGMVTPPTPPTAAEAEALFERFVLRQARTALQLSPEHVRVVEPRLRNLFGVRRRLQRERARLLNELAAATRGGGPVDEAVVGQRLEALETFRTNADTALRDAMTGVDEVLTVEQRARLRVFERRVERQKLELMARARREAGTPRDTPATADPSVP